VAVQEHSQSWLWQMLQALHKSPKVLAMQKQRLYHLLGLALGRHL
jgi:hypothetical protein